MTDDRLAEIDALQAEINRLAAIWAALQGENARLTTDLAAVTAERDRLREAIRVVLEEGAPREVGVHYAEDKRPHKGDRCPHGAYEWESCDGCTGAFLAPLLARKEAEG